MKTTTKTTSSALSDLELRFELNQSYQEIKDELNKRTEK